MKCQSASRMRMFARTQFLFMKQNKFVSQSDWDNSFNFITPIEQTADVCKPCIVHCQQTYSFGPDAIAGVNIGAYFKMEF